jgi:FAD/FMN-containing dehydrogenase
MTWSYKPMAARSRAEHGVGVLKQALSWPKRKPVEVAVMRAIKQALDPNAIMNPRVMLDIG